MSTTPTTTRRRTNKRILAALGIPAALLASCGIGATMSNDTTTPTPTATITQTAAPVEVTKTPQACIDALAHAETVMNLSAEAFTEVTEGFEAVSRMDAAGVESMTAAIEELTPRVQNARSDYDTTAQQCRAER